MADFSALKAAIQTAIKTNGNEEITGSVLQNILLSIVTTMGDGAINGLTSTLNTEMTNRQNADAALQNADIALGERISSETTSRQEADTTLQTFIGTINTKLSEGYVYSGIATPATNPGSPTGKVFYIAMAAGTYTHFVDSSSASLVISQGMNVLKFNGTAWSQEPLFGIDDLPTVESDSLVRSNGTAKQCRVSYGKTAYEGLLTSNGNYTSASSFHSLTTNKISCVTGDTFMYKGVGYGNGVSVLFYNDDTIVSSAQKVAIYDYVAITVPDGVNGVIFSSFAAAGNDVLLDVYYEGRFSGDVTELKQKIYGNILSNIQAIKANADFIPVLIPSGSKFRVRLDVLSGTITRFIITYNNSNNQRLFDTTDMTQAGKWIDVYAPVDISTIGFWLSNSTSIALSVCYGGDELMLEGIIDKVETAILKNKIGVSFGDSIMRGSGNSSRGILDILNSDYGCTGTDYAVGGATCAENIDRSHIVAQIQQAVTDQVNPDFILIDGGSNDILYSALGTLTDSFDYQGKGYTNYTDGLEYCFGLLRDNFPTKPILFMIPHSTPARSYTDEKAYWDRAIEVCRKWSVPIANVYNDGNLNTRIVVQLSAFADEGGTHPNEAGYQFAYIPLIVTKLKSIMGYKK